MVMAFFWMSGGLYYYFRRERYSRPRNDPPLMVDHPFATLLIPCHNESENLDATLGAALAQRYPADYEVIAIDDGSSDDTGIRLDALAARHPRLRVLHLDRNLGKANALRMGALAARSEYLVCIDGDAMLEEHALHWMVWHLASGSRVGAVTGNPRIRNRSTLLGRLQVAEFSSIIGMIKRAQRVYGRIFTISGLAPATRALGHPLRAERAVLHPDAGNIEGPVAAAAALGAGRRGSDAAACAVAAALEGTAHVGGAAGVCAERGVGLHHAVHRAAVGIGKVHRAAAAAAHRQPVAGMAWRDPGAGLPAAVRQQPDHRPALRNTDWTQLFLGHLVPDGVLADQPFHHPGGAAEDAAAPSPQARHLDQP
ncbi:hypothetical protein G6F57_012679 [Rhizopus arrhizus]|nr:hypothetical protein G6F57_012679 [Rhizopus arrhizus]